MQLSSTSITDGQPIDARLAFCQPRPTDGGDGGNRSPHLAWSDVPDGTRSFAVVVVDPDVPADGTDANKDDVTIPEDAARTDFYHWLLVDVPAGLREIAEGALSDRVVPGGRAPGRVTHGVEGVNDYTSFFEGSEMAGTYGGYDGPCPPFNDARLHHYHLRVYALDVESLGLPESGQFRGPDVLDALDGHVLDQAEVVGTFTRNPDVG